MDSTAINAEYHFKVRVQFEYNWLALQTNGFKNESNVDYSVPSDVRLTLLIVTVTVRPVSFWWNEMTGLRRWFENNGYSDTRDSRDRVNDKRLVSWHLIRGQIYRNKLLFIDILLYKLKKRWKIQW